mmetsp:Transcript_5944/g.11923  ORF Transcript_5944/g.11923 Transcript_5944/m.11923 type:complete len:212 (-) Transcript_5944:216-851(-)
MPRIYTEEYAERLSKRRTWQKNLHKDLKRCQTGIGVKQLLDEHLFFAGFELWEFVGSREEESWAASMRLRKKRFFAYHQGEWRTVNFKDLMRKGVTWPDGSVQQDPGKLEFDKWAIKDDDPDPHHLEPRYDPLKGNAEVLGSPDFWPDVHPTEAVLSSDSEDWFRPERDGKQANNKQQQQQKQQQSLPRPLGNTGSTVQPDNEMSFMRMQH